MKTTCWRFVACPMAALTFLAAAGCVTFEEYDLRVARDEGGGGSFTITYANLQSDDSTSAEKDFQDLMAGWKEDGFLLEGVDHGYYIKDRRLWLEKGRLMGRQTAVFADVAKIPDMKVESDTLAWQLEEGDVVLATNGTVVTRDSARAIVWGQAARELQASVRSSGFKPQAALAGRFAAWQRAHPGE